MEGVTGRAVAAMRGRKKREDRRVWQGEARWRVTENGRDAKAPRGGEAGRCAARETMGLMAGRNAVDSCSDALAIAFLRACREHVSVLLGMTAETVSRQMEGIKEENKKTVWNRECWKKHKASCGSNDTFTHHKSCSYNS